MATETKNEGSMNPYMSDEHLRVFRRLCGGTVGGIMQAASSHPFDTVKSRVQNGLFPSIGSCVRHTWSEEGFRGFYRGVTPPIIFNGLLNSILFSLNQQMANLVTPANHDPAKPLPLWRTALAAELTAPLYVLAVTPVEKVKVQMQMQGKGGAESSVLGPVACTRQIVQSHGWCGMLSGYVPTLASRLVGLPFYFMGYQTTRSFLLDTSLANTTTGKEVAVPMMSGVMAGMCFWTSNYPCDFVKTQVQASKVKVSIPEIISRTYKQGGIRAFYKGYTACVLRSAPANSTVWLGIELTTSFMQKNGW